MIAGHGIRKAVVPKLIVMKDHAFKDLAKYNAALARQAKVCNDVRRVPVNLEHFLDLERLFVLVLLIDADSIRPERPSFMR